MEDRQSVKEQQTAEIMNMVKKVDALSQEELMFIFGRGYYNDVIRGYLIDAMQRAGLDHDTICTAVNALYASFDTMTAEEALKKYQRFE